MVKRSLLFTAAILISTILCIQQAYTNNNQPPVASTGAPSEGTCASSGCHTGSTPISGSSLLSLQIVNSPSSYVANTVYSMVVNFSVSSAKRGFEITALDASGNPAGTLSLSGTQYTVLQTGGNGRQYVSNNSVTSNAAWAFKWTAPASYIGPVTFYISALAADGDNTAAGDQTYLKTYTLAAAGSSSSASANFTVSTHTACVSTPVTFTNTSTGTVVSYSWNFGNSATPATATTAGPHNVTYASTGSKVVTLTVSDGTLSSTKTDTIVVGLPPTAGITTTASTICPGSSTTLTASGGTHFTWSTGDTTASITKSPANTTTYNVTVSNGPGCSATAQQTITVRSAPNASAGSNINGCVGDTIQTTASGGVHYAWSTGDTTAHISAVALQPGSFGVQVTVTDASGCTATSGINVNIGNRATVHIPDQAVCGASSVTLDAGNPGSHFHWNTNDTTQAIQVTSPGVYSVTVTNNGCSVADTASVSISASLPVIVNDASVCQGSTTQLDAGYPGGTHVWSTGDTGRVLTVSTAGSYIVTVTSNGCSGSDTAQVTTTAPPTVDAGADQTICQGETVTIGSAPISGTTYNWIPTFGLVSPQASQTDATPQNTTSYILIAQQNGCTASDTVTITVNSAPAATFTGLAGPYCENDNNDVILQGSPSGGVFSSNATGGIFNPASAGAGTYSITYTYTDVNTTCVGRDTQTVTVNATPQPTIAGLPAQICIQDAPVALTLTPTGGSLTGPGAVGSTFDPSQTAGGNITIQYEYTDSAGCSGSTTASVDVIDLAVTASGIGGSYCTDDNTDYTLTGTPAGGTFSGPGVSGSVFNPSVAGVGQQAVVYSYSNGGCTFTDTLFVSVNGVALNTHDTTVCLGNGVTLIASGSVTYLWSTGDTDSSITVSPTDTTTYTVTVDNLNGCTATASVTVNPVPAPTVTFTGLASSYCSNEQAVTLVGSPAGGTFSGYGLNGSQFDPTTAPIGGPYPITYTYTNPYGCTDSVKHFVQVILAPTASIPVLNSDYCLDALPVTLNGQPSGGYYTGPGISNGVFVPYYAGVGQHTISYVSPQQTGCAASVTYTVTVNDLPTVSLDTIAASYCENNGPVQLNGTPAGGVFNGPGVSGSTFNPGLATAGGPQVIQYTYTDSNGCANSSFRLTEINTLPSLQVLGLAPSYCKNNNQVTVTGVPAGGVFTGDGIDFNQFIPDSAGVGTHTIVYTYTTNEGCTDSLLTDVVVKGIPNVLIYNLDSAYCLNATSFRVDVSPTGGTFSGTGLSGNVFDPLSAGAGGPYTINYTYTDTNGCSNTATKTVSVLPAANLSLSGLDSTYCSYQSIPTEIHAQPAGGILNGAGVVDTTFSPALAGPGEHVILYLYTNPLGCVSYQTFTVTVQNCLDGIDQPNQLGDVKLYPNPTTGMLNLELNGFTDNEGVVNLFNIQGQQILTEKLNNIAGNSINQINLSNIAPGIYMLRIQTASGSRIEKVVVQ